MTRTEMLQKLSTVKLCATNLEFTVDWGVQFDIITGKGASTNVQNLVWWPCFQYPMTDEVKHLKNALAENNDITDQQMLQYDFIKLICTYRDYSTRGIQLEGKLLTECLSFIRKEIKNIDTDKDSFYVYSSINDWDMDVKMFDSEEGMEDYFLKCWEPSESYSEMDYDQIKYWYDAAEAEDWFGLPRFSCNKSE